MCHKSAKRGNQYGKWLETKHAKAYEALKSEAAVKAAKGRGIDKPPSEAPACLKCHTTGYGADPSQFAASFKLEDGVQCEACHGPGKDYKKKSIMKDREQAIANGLNPIKVEDGTAEKWCVRCHNEESPNFKGFNFKEYFAKIKHPRPAE